MSDDEAKSGHHHHDGHGHGHGHDHGPHHHHHQQQQYGTFGGGPAPYPPQQPAMDFPSRSRRRGSPPRPVTPPRRPRATPRATRLSQREVPSTMSDDEAKSGHHHHDGHGHGHHHHHDHGPHHHLHQQQYGTFGGGPAPYPPQQPAMGFPQPVPPPGVTAAPGHPSAAPTYYAQGYQAVPGYAAVAEGRPVREPPLPCCGCGMGWFLFFIGFLLVAIPWYVGAFVLLCVRVDYREKPGYIACTIGAVVASIAILFGATKGADVW